MDRTATQVITRALRAAKVMGADQSASSFPLSDGLLALQAMLDGWTADTQLHYLPDHGLPAFADLTTPVAVPAGLTVALEYYLALLLAPENGQALDPRLAGEALEALRRRRAMIAALRVKPMALEAVQWNDASGGGYDIEADA